MSSKKKSFQQIILFEYIAETNLKYNTVRKNYLLQLILFSLTALFIVLACRDEVVMTEDTVSVSADKRSVNFFKNQSSVPLKNGFIINQFLPQLQEINNNNNFIAKLSDKKGLPLWKYANYSSSNKTTGKESEDFIVVPMSVVGSEFLTSVLYIVNPDSDNPVIYTITNEQLHTFVQTSVISKEAREAVLGTFLYFDTKVFGVREYNSIPLDLFDNVTVEDGESFRSFTISASENTPIGRQEEICITFYNCVGCQSTCDLCSLCVSTRCYPLGGGTSGGDNEGGPTNPGNPGNPGDGTGGGVGNPSNPNVPWYLQNPDFNIYEYSPHIQQLFQKMVAKNIVLQKPQVDYLEQNVDIAIKFKAYITQNNNAISAQFVNWGINFFMQNPDITWEQFQNWFIDPVTQQDIISELQNYACAQGIVQQLPTLNNDIALSMKNVFQNNVNYNIIFRAKSGMGNVDGETFASTSNTGGFKAIINLNDQILLNATKEYILATMYHEVIHAFLDYEKFRLGNVLFHSTYPSVLVGYSYDSSGKQINRYTFLPQHNQLGAFLTQLENIISTYNPNLPVATVKAMAKAGITTMTFQEQQLNLDERNTLLNNFKGTKCP